jgi:transcriptional regulator with XRE-family HTH domain
VFPKNEKEFAMTAAVVEVRTKLSGLVQRRERQTQSLMLAYSDVASQIGRSESWVRGFLRGDSRFNPSHVMAKNIEALCEYIETGNEKLRRAENAAAHQSNLGMREVEDSTALLPPNEYRE